MHKSIFLALLVVSRVMLAACPNPDALTLFRERIAFERTWAESAFKGKNRIQVNVWSTGQVTGFYIQDPTGPHYDAGMQERYVFAGKDGIRDGSGCDLAKNWPDCLTQIAGASDAPLAACQLTIDLRTIPAWRPSPNGPEKKRATEEMRREIEARYPDANEIVARDFNLLDHQITFYAKTPDHDYYQGFSFYADREPHCEGWHLFGMAPLSGIRKWIFARPYRLK